MKSYFTKFGAMLLCGVMLAVVGCHDYAEDIQQVNDKVDNLNTSVATEVEALENAIAELDAKLATDAELKKAIDDLQASLSNSITEEVEAINAVIAKLGDTYATDAELSSAVSALNSSIEGVKDAYAKADEDLQKALQAKIDLKADASVVEALDALVDENVAAIEGLEKDVEDLEVAYKDADDKLKTELTNKIETSVAAVSAKVDGLTEALGKAEDRIKANEDAIAILKPALEKAEGDIANNAAAIKTLVDANLITRLGELETAHQTLKTAYETELAKLKEADTNLEGKITNLTTRVQTLEGDLSKVQGDIDSINGIIAKLNETYATDEELKNAITEASNALTQAYQAADATLQNQINAIKDAIAAAKVDINNLIKRVQSIVYVPEYTDGAARLNYATLGGQVLEGYSQLTYKVYPAEYAKQIATVEKATPFLSYDLTAELKGNDGAKLEIIKAEANDKGELVVTVKPHLGSDFYTSATTRAAALVLAKPASETNNVSDYYSTEYTNIIADKDGSKAIEMVLYKGDEAFDGMPEKFTWPFLATGESWKVTLQNGLNARFAYNGSVYKAGDLKEEYGYVVEYKREVSYSAYPDKYFNIKNIKVTEPAKDDYTQYVTAQPVSHEEASIVKHSHIDNWVKAVYTYTCSGQKLTAESTVALVEFPYTYMVAADKDLTTEGISYIRDDKRVVLEGKIRDYFVDAEGNEVEVATLMEQFPALVPEYGVKYNNTEDVVSLFNIEGKQYPVSVSLAKGEDGKNLAKKEDVGKKLNVEYTFNFPVLNKKVQTRASSVEILKAQYKFDLGLYNTIWNWTADHDEEAAGTAYNRDFAIENPAQYVDEDVKYTEVASSIKNYVVKCGDDVVNNVTVSFASDKLSVSGFAWDKTYKVEATYDITTDGVVGAQVTVNFEFATVGRPDDLYEIDLGTQDVTYTVDQVFEGLSVGEIKTKVNELLPEANRGTGFDLDTYLVDAISAGVVAKINGKVAPTNSGLVIAANGYDVTAKYHFEDGVALDFVEYKATMPCTLEFTAPYGQKFLVKKTLNFVVPTYTFGHDYYKLWEGKYAKAQGKFYPEDQLPITKFEVNKIQMLDIFNKLTDSANNSVFENLGKDLVVVFTPDKAEHASLMKENILTYNSKDPKIYVGAKLYIKNSNDVLVEAPTNFETTYKDFYVEKYDPIKSLTVAPKTVTLKDRREYKVNLLELLSLVDEKDRIVIKNGALETNNYSSAFNFENDFGLKLEYDDAAAKEALHVDLKDHVKFNDVDANTSAPAYLQDLELVFDYSSDIYLTEGFEIKIPVKYTNYWGEDKNDIVIKFILQ